MSAAQRLVSVRKCECQGPCRQGRPWRVLDRSGELLSDYRSFRDAIESAESWWAAEADEIDRQWSKANKKIVEFAPLIRMLDDRGWAK